MNKLYEALKYTFRDEALLRTALTHPSYHGGKGEDYQRLEFLGDAVLELAVSGYLYASRGDMAEGELTRARAYLVCEDTLSRAAEKLGLADAIRMGNGEYRGGGSHKSSILCDVFEAVLAAIYLDGGFREAERFALENLAPFLEGRDLSRVKDPKSMLQERLQRGGHDAPVYVLLSASGPAHAPRFSYAVEYGGERLGTGEGSSKQEAQQCAAREALERLKTIEGAKPI